MATSASGSSYDSLGLVIGLVLGLFVIIAIVVVIVVLMKKRRPARRPIEGPHVSNIKVTLDRDASEMSPYEYVNPIGVTSTDSPPTGCTRPFITNGLNDIPSQYITVSASPDI